ncbi:hypothetical protein FPANT_4960 [Fusarium pseudoanthophilum]|uniref:SnoaL-like domain-containing protein n=1 Tax=Fusarium pseudoanthophilum TaxID=48495 RepID=A0A8H5UP26_9HYPO|nr:hypothetical protein FPANT_4960 [Fusarium pseudoanthophilum]
MVVEKGHKIFIPADQLTATEVDVEWQQSFRKKSVQYYAVPFFNRDQDNEESVIFIQTTHLDSLRSKGALKDQITVIVDHSFQYGQNRDKTKRWLVYHDKINNPYQRFILGLIFKLGNDALKFRGGFIPSIDRGTLIFNFSALLVFTNKAVGASTQRIVEIAGINTSNVTIWDCPSSTSPDISLPMIQTAMNDFAYTFYTEKDVKRAFERYVASNYVQHNPSIPDGRDAAVKILSPLFNSPDNTFEIARVMVGPEYTTIHIKAGGANESLTNVFDVYRTKGSCIVEHWDCLQAMEKNTTSHHPYF